MGLIYDQESAEIGKYPFQSHPFPIADVKLSIAVYLRNFMRGVIARFSGDEISTAVIQRYIGIFYDALISPLITPPLKKHFVLIFESVVTVFLSLEEVVENVKNFYNQLFTQVHNVIANGGSANINVTKGALYVS
jgi:hypothetical protein